MPPSTTYLRTTAAHELRARAKHVHAPRAPVVRGAGLGDSSAPAAGREGDAAGAMHGTLTAFQARLAQIEARVADAPAGGTDANREMASLVSALSAMQQMDDAGGSAPLARPGVA